MKVLIGIANPGPQSFCDAILEQFGRGLEEAAEVFRTAVTRAVSVAHRCEDDQHTEACRRRYDVARPVGIEYAI